MANISAQMVKELRDKTGAGMMDCKAALGETQGDLESAVDWLRKKGLSKAAKKAGRVAAEGLIGVAVAGKKGVVVEVNSETDFVARNEQFQGLVRMIAGIALDVGPDVENIKAAKVGGVTVERRHQFGDRHHRREHDVAPRRAGCRSGPARSGPTSIIPWPKGSARSASSSASNRPGRPTN